MPLFMTLAQAHQILGRGHESSPPPPPPPPPPPGLWLIKKSRARILSCLRLPYKAKIKQFTY